MSVERTPDVRYNNPSSGTPQGTAQYANLAFVVDDSVDYSSGKWRPGITQTYNPYIVSDTYSMGWTDESNAAPTFWRAHDGTDSELLTLINQLPERDGSHFNDISSAKSWIDGTNKYVLFPLDEINPHLKMHLDAGNSSSYSGSGSTWYDLSGNSNNGTISNAQFSIGSPTNRFDFNGTNAYISIGQPIPSGSSYTIIAWVYASVTSGSRNIVSSQNTPFWISNGTLYAGLAGNYNLVGYPNFPQNQWKFVAVTFNHTTHTMKLYVDGVLVSANYGVNLSYTAENTYIGSHFSGGQNVSFWGGSIASVLIHNTEKNPLAIASIYQITGDIYT